MEIDLSNENKEITRNEKSEKEMLVEILKLTLKLIWKITYHTVRITYKGIKWLIRTIYTTSKKTIEWWNDNDTQIKFRFFKIKFKSACKTLYKWSVVAAIAFWKFIIWTCKMLIKAIINLKHTFKVIVKGTLQGFRISVKWCKKILKKCKYKNARLKVKYRNFRKTPGFKGLLTDTNNYLKEILNNFMEEEQ